jgi:hypothetical protein
MAVTKDSGKGLSDDGILGVLILWKAPNFPNKSGGPTVLKNLFQV